MNTSHRARPLALVVDDDDTMRIMIRAVLEGIDIAVEEAVDGVEALDRVAALRPDIVLLDVKMPRMDGFACCARLRTRGDTGQMPILMMTAAEDLVSIERAYDAGATDFVRKPFPWPILGHRVRYMLRSAATMAAFSRTQATLAHAQKLARLGSWEWTVRTDHIHFSDEACRLVDRSTDAMPRHLGGFVGLLHPDDRGNVERALCEALDSGRPLAIECRVLTTPDAERNFHLQAEVRCDEAGEPIELLGVLQDITERRSAERRIRELDTFDALTGLPNRRFFREQIERAIGFAHRMGHSLALLQINVDRFKRINETLGHAAGDALLAEIARRVATTVRGSDLVSRNETQVGEGAARLGADEFVVLVNAPRQAADAARVAARLHAAFARPHRLEANGVAHDVVLTASIGIAVYPADGADADTLLRNADSATTDTRNRGGNNFQFFTESMNTAALEKLTLESELRLALERDQFFLHYQPKFDIVTGAIIGAEALVRWRHPEHGVISPARFIPLAEETGIIVPLGEWVLRTAAREVAHWHGAGFPSMTVAVNLSAQNFVHGGMEASVNAAFAESGIDPRSLEIEVTETMLMHDVDVAVRILRWFRGRGIRVSIDDFGTGYSSLSYLRRFPLDILKIDRSFVQEATQNADAAAITRGIIALARSLNLEVIAEGVETHEQALFLNEHGCRYVQGFLYGRPMTSADLLARLAEVRARAMGIGSGAAPAMPAASGIPASA